MSPITDFINKHSGNEPTQQDETLQNDSSQFSGPRRDKNRFSDSKEDFNKDMDENVRNDMSGSYDPGFNKHDETSQWGNRDVSGFDNTGTKK
ncbi:unnamed protein product [Kuraishia capsulata CBS 1993]|uniref:Uncharacterized protein n=1 Tax=Kuraishia capsulata CBS 1993 TaxID=1382522 RepID=W6MFW8_9ASCO|nr:uncharacterized protein KUCA_T00000501001 [Kuraishia capsulata CBS 1993]CDK24536.1 unnamed protein product [Kuraishia capsulata CBS 1993]